MGLAKTHKTSSLLSQLYAMLPLSVTYHSVTMCLTSRTTELESETQPLNPSLDVIDGYAGLANNARGN